MLSCRAIFRFISSLTHGRRRSTEITSYFSAIKAAVAAAAGSRGGRRTWPSRRCSSSSISRSTVLIRRDKSLLFGNDRAARPTAIASPTWLVRSQLTFLFTSLHVSLLFVQNSDRLKRHIAAGKKWASGSSLISDWYRTNPLYSRLARRWITDRLSTTHIVLNFSLLANILTLQTAWRGPMVSYLTISTAVFTGIKVIYPPSVTTGNWVQFYSALHCLWVCLSDPKWSDLFQIKTNMFQFRGRVCLLYSPCWPLFLSISDGLQRSRSPRVACKFTWILLVSTCTCVQYDAIRHTVGEHYYNVTDEAQLYNLVSCIISSKCIIMYSLQSLVVVWRNSTHVTSCRQQQPRISCRQWIKQELNQ